MSKETSAEIASIAGRILNQGRAIENIEQYNTDALRLAASALAQREPDVFQVGKIRLENCNTYVHVTKEIHEFSRVARVVPVDDFEGLLEPLFTNPTEPVADPVAAQIEGEPIFELSEDMEIKENPVEANFQFYVDGYTLKGTTNIGEVSATAPDGRTTIFKSNVLTQFLERRMYPTPLISGGVTDN